MNANNANWVAEMMGLSIEQVMVPGSLAYLTAAGLPDDFLTALDPDATDESGVALDLPDCSGH
jgi:hypothetical protein